MKVNENFVLRKIKEEYFLVHFKANEISRDVIFLNSVGAQVFQMAPDCLNVSLLTENVAEVFQVENDGDAKRMIRDFIDEMLTIGLLMEEI